MDPPKSNLLGGLGTSSKIIKRITDAVLARGGSDEDVRAIVNDDELVNGIADLIIAARPGAESKSAKSKLPLVGTIVKTLVLLPYEVSSFAEAIKLGKYDTVGRRLDVFANDDLGLGETVKVYLVEFDRDPYLSQVLEWGIANSKRPIESKHLHAIGIQHPEEQRQASIVELASLRQGAALYLLGSSSHRDLLRLTVDGILLRSYRFGFVSK